MNLSRIFVAIVIYGVGAAPTFAHAQDDKRAFEIADYYRTAFVGEPAVSADGARRRAGRRSGWWARTATGCGR